MKTKENVEVDEKPVAWVPMGDKSAPELTFGPAWHMITTSEAQVKYWKEECNLLVAPLFMGKAE
jgi:hypothetical protein